MLTTFIILLGILVCCAVQSFDDCNVATDAVLTDGGYYNQL